MSNGKTILLVGGGTGGHIVPIFELYDKLKSTEPDIKVKVVGGGTWVEQQFFSSSKDYIVIETGKFHRSFALKNIGEIRKFILGRSMAKKILIDLKPDLIFSKGGYVSLPIIYWAKKLKIPYFIHESDIEMGEANKFAANSAKKIFVGFETDNYSMVNNGKIIFAGQFISPKLIPTSKKVGLFNNNKPTIFVTGGSQGASAINDIVIEIIPSLLESYNVIHQTGAADFSKVAKTRDMLGSSLRSSYIIKDFFSHTDEAESIYRIFGSSDLFIGRASITFPAEAAISEIPMILIPYPHAAGDHQLKNGIALEKAGACVLIRQRDLSVDKLRTQIDDLIVDHEKRDKMIANAKKSFSKNALDIVSQAILEEIKE